MVDQIIGIILSLSNEEKLNLLKGEGKIVDEIEKNIELLNEDEKRDIYIKFEKIYFDIPDQEKIDYISRPENNGIQFDVLYYIKDRNFKISFFDNYPDKSNYYYVNAFFDFVISIEDEKIRYEYIKNNIDIFNSYMIPTLFISFTSDEYLMDFLHNNKPDHDGKIDFNLYGILIAKLKDDKNKQIVFEKYKSDYPDGLGIACNPSIINSFKDESIREHYINQLLLIEEEDFYNYDQYKLSLIDIVCSLTDDNKKFFYIDKLEKKFNGIDPFYFMKSISDQSIKINIFKKYIQNDYNIDEICEFLDSIEDKKVVKELISIAIDRNAITTTNFNRLLGLIEDKKEKVELLNKMLPFFGPEIEKYFKKLSEKNGESDLSPLLFNLLDEDINLGNFIETFNNPEIIFESTDNFKKAMDCYIRIIKSNSSELLRVSKLVGRMLGELPIDKWDETITRIEDVFLKNNTPYVGKIFKVFEIMHPDDYVKHTQSPNINRLYGMEGSTSKKVGLGSLIFSDLLKCAIGSNNRSLIEYINNIEQGNAILKELISGQINITDLTGERKDIFTTYIFHLNTLYNNTKAGKENPRQMKENLVKDVYELLYCFLYEEKKGFSVDELPDRIVRLFCHFAGIDTIAELKELMIKEITEADTRNRRRAEENNFTLERGDFYKGLVNENYDEHGRFYTFLINILQNGSISKEFLGSDARSDTTPLDTDLSRIETDLESFSEPFVDNRYAAARYGPLWLVVKNDDRLNYSKETGEYIPDKLEIFRTNMDGAGHYGIRTGFPSSDIDYFVVDESRLDIKRIEYSIVMNGFYIPVLNTDGKLIFTPEQYDNMRKDLYGLSHYGLGNVYEFAEELDTFDPRLEPFDINIDGNKSNSNIKRNLIINALSSVGLDISTSRNVYMKHGEIELLDTGSTGRGTNMSKDYDFDFVMRVDKEVFDNDLKMNELKNKIEEALPGIGFDGHHVRNQIININGTNIKIDISIIIKDDKIGYTTEECIKDRLSSIEKIDPEKHKKVLENIVLAKEVLKDGECYKPAHAGQGQAQGGLGGVGVENWILQNGGSFEKAARSFLEVASQCATFEEFKSRYYIFNFGENHMYYRESDKYKHNEFISGNMDASGYEKMKETLSKYIIQLEERRRLEGNKIL